MNFKVRLITVLIFGAIFSAIAGNALAASIGDTMTFNVDKDFDATARTQTNDTLIKITNSLYYYVESSWWNSQPEAKQTEVLASLDGLSQEFDNRIYPKLTSVFGSEWRPGVDGDNRITILFEPMNSAEGGYFNEADEYIKLQVPTSNEREMLYISLDKIDDPNVKIILGHELVHLITFNQKNETFGVEEDTWLNEARADYASTILGYDDNYEGSNLQQRVNDFVENPSDSITEWAGTKYDYASVSLFTHYLVDHYGINILIDSLKSKYVGIDSINYALQKNGYKENFAQIFTDWTIASVLNDCSVNQKYCYLNQNLVNFRLDPVINFLPLTGNVSLSVTNVTKSWTGNWLKFIGGNGNLKLNFSSLKGLTFQVPYIIQDSAGSNEVKFLTIDQNETGEIDINKFGTDYKSLTIIPSLQSDVYKTDDVEPTYPFSYTVSIQGSASNSSQDLMQQLLNKINSLKQQIAAIQGGPQEESATQSNTCSMISDNLYFGIYDGEVSCLQQFLKNQGTNIYPEGLITGFFGNLTKRAVINFQKEYGIPQTGFVGLLTRNKINQTLNAQ